MKSGIRLSPSAYEGAASSILRRVERSIAWQGVPERNGIGGALTPDLLPPIP